MSIEELLGKTLTKVEHRQGDPEDILFTLEDEAVFKMHHSQDCCESVSINDINGDLQDLIGSPILQASERCSAKLEEEMTAEEKVMKVEQTLDNEADTYEGESTTWTFYRLATVKGTVVIRWFGTSNGYYSESVYVDKQE